MLPILTPRQRAEQALLFAALCILSVIWLMPIVTVVLSSLRDQGDLISRGIFALPETLVFDNYAEAWETGGFSIYFKKMFVEGRTAELFGPDCVSSDLEMRNIGLH